MVANSDKYISYSGTRVSNSEIISGKTGAHNDDQLRRDSIYGFLREIYQYKGYVMYRLFDNKATNFYVGKNGTFGELEYCEYIKDASFVIPYNAYKLYIAEQLAGETSKSSEQKIEKLRGFIPY